MSEGTLNGQELELFKTGDYSGLGKGTFTAEDMRGIVDRYNAAGEAPIAIGHVKSDKEPAYGWIKSVLFSGDTLYGTPGEVSPELDQLHRDGKYRNRSVSFAKDKDGNRYLHHVAILGAVPPECKGLRQATFGTTQYDEFETKEAPVGAEEQQKTAIADGIREFFSSLGFGGKPKELTQEEMIAKATEAVQAKFSAELATERAAREAAEAKFSASTSKSAAQVRAAGARQSLITTGCWIPAYDKLGVPELFSALAERTETISFSALDGTAQKPDLLDAMVGVLNISGRIVPTERVVEFSATDGKKQSAPIPDGNGIEVDPDSAAFSAMVTQHAKEHKTSWNEAYTALSREGKRPQSGSSAAGAV